MAIICLLLNLYLIALFGRIILSWFPMEPGTPLASVYQFLFTVTEPLLGPLRRAIPPIGGGTMRFDLSPLIVLIGIQILKSAVLGC
jgi:YggT family protein